MISVESSQMNNTLSPLADITVSQHQVSGYKVFSYWRTNPSLSFYFKLAIISTQMMKIWLLKLSPVQGQYRVKRITSREKPQLPAFSFYLSLSLCSLSSPWLPHCLPMWAELTEVCLLWQMAEIKLVLTCHCLLHIGFRPVLWWRLFRNELQ